MMRTKHNGGTKVRARIFHNTHHTRESWPVINKAVNHSTTNVHDICKIMLRHSQ